MKHIYIVRHAKSSWSDLTISDVDRPLNERGKRDAPRMAERCRELGVIPELIISSNAKRAMETCTFFINQYKLPDAQVQLNKKLYHAPEHVYIEEAQLVDDRISSVMMFGHNPGITYLANSISEKFIDNVPTCGVLIIESKVNSWMDLDLMNCKLINFLYPKML
jgi:phosphohistidine phosphatase